MEAKESRLVILFLMSVAVLLLPLVSLAQADSPTPPPGEYRICNEGITYCARIIPGEDTTVFKIDGPATNIVGLLVGVSILIRGLYL